MGVVKIATSSGIKIARQGDVISTKEYDILPGDLLTAFDDESEDVM